MIKAPAAFVLTIVASAAMHAAPAIAEGVRRQGSGIHHHMSARTLPAEIRYRDPRYVAPPPQALGSGAPDFLIHAYLPRTTEAPIYNEPPSRFPAR